MEKSKKANSVNRAWKKYTMARRKYERACQGERWGYRMRLARRVDEAIAGYQLAR